MFNENKLKQSYVGIVSIYDLKSKKVLLQGGGHFDVANRKLDVLFDCQDAYKDVEWLPILETEDGYFCPAQTQKGHLVGFGGFSFDHRSRYGMSSYFHWKREKGIDHIAAVFDSATIEVAGINGGWPASTFSADWKNVQMVTKGIVKDIESVTDSDITVTAKATYSSSSTSVSQRIRFKIMPKASELTWSSWIPLVHAFRLYWLFQHDRTDCDTFGFVLGDSLDLVTDMMRLPGFDDNTDIVSPGLHIDAVMNTKLLAQTTNFFLRQTKTRGGIAFAFYRLLGYRYGSGTKRVGDDLLDLVFALDGFCADVNKNAQRKLTKAEKEAARRSIRTVLEQIEQHKDDLDPLVYDFYNKPEDKIFDGITHKPYRESVRQCFETLGMDYAEHEQTVVEVDKIRQVFVHGKGHDTTDLAAKIYTHGTVTFNESDDSGSTEIVFGQATGLSEQYYKMIRLLFRSYFQGNK